MAMNRWDPFAGLTDLRREVDRLFDEFFGRRRAPRAEASLLEARGWTPDVDMFDREDELVIKAELPGVGIDNISTSATSDSITIRGEAKREEIKDEDYYYRERNYGNFARTISLPVEVETNKIKASYKDGVLEIVLPKAKEVVGREVRIEVE